MHQYTTNQVQEHTTIHRIHQRGKNGVLTHQVFYQILTSDAIKHKLILLTLK
jgi:hypothetical protein